MTRFMLVMVLALLPLVALAQVEEPAADSVDVEYTPYVATDFGFSVKLPTGGAVLDASSEGWDKDKEIAFEWRTGGADPVELIVSRVDRFPTELDADSFNVFCDTLIEGWSDSTRFNIVTANRRIDIENRTWNLIEVEDASLGEDKMVYYSVFVMFSGENIYSISLYYLTPVSEMIQEFGIPIIYSFDLTK